MKTFAKVLVLAVVMGIIALPILSQEKEEKKLERATSTGWAVELFDHFITAMNVSQLKDAKALCTENVLETWEDRNISGEWFGKDNVFGGGIPDDHQFNTWTRTKEVISPDGNSFRFTARLTSKHRKIECKVIMLKEEGSTNKWRVDSLLIKELN